MFVGVHCFFFGEQVRNGGAVAASISFFLRRFIILSISLAVFRGVSLAVFGGVRFLFCTLLLAGMPWFLLLRRIGAAAAGAAAAAAAALRRDQDSLRACLGHAWGMLRACSEYSQNVLWTCSERSQNIIRIFSARAHNVLEELQRCSVSMSSS